MQNLSQATDEQLVSLYEQGNDAAFDQLLARYQQKLYSYILSYVRDEDIANDIFQEVFIKAITHIRSHKYVDKGRFLQWLMRMAHNMMIDLFRHQQTFPMVRTEEQGSELRNNIHHSDDSIEESIVKEQTLAEIEQLITLLPQPQQEIVRLRIYDNMPFKQIAELKGCSINTALGRMRYAVLNLRRMAANRDLHMAL